MIIFHDAPTVKVRSFGLIVFVTARHIIRRISVLNSIGNSISPFFIQHFICMDRNAIFINIGDMIGFVDHGVEIQAFTIVYVFQQFLPDYGSDPINVQSFIVVFCIRDRITSVGFSSLNPALKHFSCIKVYMRIIDVCVHLAGIVLIPGNAHNSNFCCLIYKMNIQPSVMVFFARALHNRIYRESVGCKSKSI